MGKTISVAPQNRDAFNAGIGLTSLSAVLSGVGFAQGTLGRLISEQPVVFGISVISVVVGVFLLFRAGLLKNNTARERELFHWGNILLLVGFIAGIVGAILVWSNTRPPILSVANETGPGGAFLNVSVKDSGLDAHEVVRVRVEHMRKLPGRTKAMMIYSSIAGSDDDGKVDQTIKVPLPPGVHGLVRTRAYTGHSANNCGDDQNTTACVTVNVLREPESPQLSGRWKRRRVLLVIVKAHNLRVSHRTIMRSFGVLGTGKKRKLVKLAVWRLPPEASGNFRRPITIRDARRYTSICVVASTRGKSGPRRCPPKPDKHDAWLQYRVPGR